MATDTICCDHAAERLLREVSGGAFTYYSYDRNGSCTRIEKPDAGEDTYFTYNDARLLASVHALRSGLGAARAAGWGAFGLVGGLPAVVTCFAAAGRPRVERCRACGKRKPIADAECPCCGAPIPEPEPTGIEIFE